MWYDLCWFDCSWPFQWNQTPGRMNTDCSLISYFVSDFIHVVKYFMKYLTWNILPLLFRNLYCLFLHCQPTHYVYYAKKRMKRWIMFLQLSVLEMDHIKIAVWTFQMRIFTLVKYYHLLPWKFTKKKKKSNRHFKLIKWILLLHPLYVVCYLLCQN